MENIDIKNVQRNIATCSKIYEMYSSLLNCYVLDFYIDDHWNKLLKNWQISLDNLDPTEIAELLNHEGAMNNRMWPLSILTLKSILKRLSIQRKLLNIYEDNPYFNSDEKLLKLFWKNVKFKKRHEISIMSKICYKCAKQTNCFYIIDIGSGLGHLSRMLNYGYKFNVCAIEAQRSLTEQARNLDQEFEKNIENKFRGCLKNHQRTVHVNMKVHISMTVPEFLKVIKSALNIDHDDFKFGIVGLHPCGDLGATLLRIYNECSNAQFINIVGCCYMKLSTSMSSPTQGFPLSYFCKTNKYDLSYHSREIACHAIENYIDKLLKGESWRLKIHSYRALLEKIIVQMNPQLHHSALNNVKYTPDLTFEKYCMKAVGKLELSIPANSLQGKDIENCLKKWKKVVVFYSLRLLFAPLIETIILLDRFLYIVESGSSCEIIPVFDPRVSPRAHILTAKKK